MSLEKLVQKLLLMGIFALPSAVFGQTGSAGPIRMDGPKQTDVGKVIRINIEGIKGLNDPKLECIPKNDAWEAVQKLDGTPILLFFPAKEGLYTFIVAGNKDNKTYFETFQVQVGKTPVPQPPAPPKPDPGPEGKYTKQLTSPYMVNPDNVSLAKLIAVYQSVSERAGTVSNYKQLNDALASATKAAIGETPLRGVRDAVSLILQTDLANRNSQTYDAVATRNIFLELSKSLTPLLEK